jgi:hypothetical protein
MFGMHLNIRAFVKLQRLPVSSQIDERQPPANFITPTQSAG